MVTPGKIFTAGDGVERMEVSVRGFGPMTCEMLNRTFAGVPAGQMVHIAQAAVLGFLVMGDSYEDPTEKETLENHRKSILKALADSGYSPLDLIQVSEQFLSQMDELIKKIHEVVESLPVEPPDGMVN